MISAARHRTAVLRGPRAVSDIAGAAGRTSILHGGRQAQRGCRLVTREGAKWPILPFLRLRRSRLGAVLTVFGVAYTTFSRQPIKGYWEVLVPFIVLVCIRAGWHNASDNAGRWRLSSSSST